jgi:hypothetical protein
LASTLSAIAQLLSPLTGKCVAHSTLAAEIAVGIQAAAQKRTTRHLEFVP